MAASPGIAAAKSRVSASGSLWRRTTIAGLRAMIIGLRLARQDLGGGEYKKADTSYPLRAAIDLVDVLEITRAAAPRENAPPFFPARQYQLR